MTFASPAATRGYASAAAMSRDPRSNEGEALRRAIAALAAGRSAGFPALASAVHQNRRLWTLLGAQAADPGNARPAELRGRILSLARFASEHGSRVLRRQADVEPLIEINRAVMQGLRAPSEAAA
ncbi:MAG: flagellar biosynthesis regulator FlaF [Hasllibacter sp.]